MMEKQLWNYVSVTGVGSSGRDECSFSLSDSDSLLLLLLADSLLSSFSFSLPSFTLSGLVCSLGWLCLLEGLCSSSLDSESLFEYEKSTRRSTSTGAF